MGAIQSSINSMIGSASHAIMFAKGYQELKAKKEAEAAKKTAQGTATPNNKGESASPQQVAKERAEISLANAIEAKKEQRERALTSQERLEALRASGRAIL